MAEADLSKIVNLIMENPKLIEEIKSMVNKSEGEEHTEEEIPIPVSEKSENTVQKAEDISTGENTYFPSRSSRRTELLRALRPYLSKERGRAIESMITVADILLAVKEN